MERGEGNWSTPDLQSILATLAEFSNSAPTAQKFDAVGSPAPAIDQEASISASSARLIDGPTAKDPRPRPQSRSATAPSRPMIDPASITVWPEALRCVTKIAAQNAQFAASIKRMIKDQRENEMRWYGERQNLKQVQANRSTSTAKAQSILKSLNTSFYGIPPEGEDPETKKAKELAEFDEKIYTAQLAMENAMTVELKGLGVPFFGTNPSLVVPDGEDKSEDKLLDNRPKWSPLLTESELLQLRRRMVSHLEDLFRD